jgi:DNA-directed RNA polymerase specialized sigma24 family protein
MLADNELLRRYCAERSESAFAELVQRHATLVYGAALRQLNGNTDLARDATQMVFTDLALKAASLANHRSLVGWLYTSARFA